MQTTASPPASEDRPWIPPPPRPFRRQASAADALDLAFRLDAWGKLGSLWATEPCR